MRHLDTGVTKEHKEGQGGASVRGGAQGHAIREQAIAALGSAVCWQLTCLR